MSESNFEKIPQPETISSPEHRPDSTASSQPSEIVRPVIESKPTTFQIPVSSTTKDPQLLTIEGVLSEGLDEAYMAMTAAKRQQFRQKGEETARAIQHLVSHGKANMNKVRSLIVKWLKLIPGVNRFFLEQEAKIKADKILQR